MTPNLVIIHAPVTQVQKQETGPDQQCAFVIMSTSPSAKRNHDFDLGARVLPFFIPASHSWIFLSDTLFNFDYLKLCMKTILLRVRKEKISFPEPYRSSIPTISYPEGEIKAQGGAEEGGLAVSLLCQSPTAPIWGYQ